MKLSGRDAARFASAPDFSLAGVLIYGDNVVEVAARRKMVIDAALGGDGLRDEGGELRLTRIPATELRKDKVIVRDAIKARGFFSGPQATLVEDATDGCSEALETALAASEPGDGFLVVTAGRLLARSRLRKQFETARNAASAPCYDDAPDREEIGRLLAAEGDPGITDEAVAGLETLARSLDAAGMRDLITRLALYRLGDDEPISAGDVALCAPGAGDVDIDDGVDAVIEGRPEAVGPILARMRAQGRSATSLAIGAARRLRVMHGVLADAEHHGADAALKRVRPPVFGPRRDALARACRVWTSPAVEAGLKVLLETDDQLRRSAPGSGYATLERAFLKLSLTAARLRRR